MIPWITRNLIYYPITAMRGENVRRYMNQVRNFHSLSYDQMRDIQWQKLQRLLSYLNDNNRYYRTLFHKHDIDVNRIRTDEDFRRIPFLTKDAVRDHSADMLSTERFRLSHRRTSGSTGIPLNFVKDRASSAYMEAVVHSVYAWHNISIGDRQARIWAMSLNLKKNLTTRLKDILLNRKRLSSHAITDDTCREYYHTLKRFRPKFMYGLSSTITEFVRAIQRLELEPKDIGLEVIIITGEILYPRNRKLVEEAFGCPVVNEYGTTENGIIAFQCPHKRMHLMVHNLYLEFINPDTGRPAGSGELGEVVLTELHSYAMPFVRYRLYDMVTVGGVKKCECGVELPIIDNIEGRVLDLLVAPDGRRVSTSVTSYLMTEGVHRYRVTQKDINRFEILVEKTASCSEHDLTAVVTNFKKFFGEQVIIDMKLVNRIPPDPSGKLRSFISELNAEKKGGTKGPVKGIT